MKIKNSIFSFFLLFTIACQSQHNKNTMETTEHKYTNKLANETSPYLLQHQHNPVNWMPWGDAAFAKAKKEDKLVIVSIGYSACHWCHVMEHECFEDEEVAKVMNDNYISIKVDREERPDVDAIYMNACQLMNQRGGWPLNVIVLPDGRPIFAGTYFPKKEWIRILNQVKDVYVNDKEKVLEYAEKLTKGVQQSELISYNATQANFTRSDVDNYTKIWMDYFKTSNGGRDGSPKFPIPNNYLYLLRAYHLNKDQQLLDYINLRLTDMGYGGIYDQIGGGFARYSVDAIWKVPHFEKMLYDNAQLITLYSEAYQLTKNSLYKDVVYETIEFVKRELTSSEGAFYSALDADSEGEEGKFYVWKKEELQTLLKDDFEVLKDYYNINSKGLWEHGNYILLRREDNEAIAKKHNITIDELAAKIANSKTVLMAERDKRIRPGLDDKSLTSWSGLMLKSLATAYAIFNEQQFLDLALTNQKHLLNNLKKSDGGLYHSFKEGRKTINGFLEDYAFTIEALLAMYQVTFDEQLIVEANKFTQYTLQHFYDKKSGMFYFTSDEDKGLIARKMEIIDGVIPASASVMANNLFALSFYTDSTSYYDKSQQMLNNIKPMMGRSGISLSNWGILMLNSATSYYEIAVVGKQYESKIKELNQTYLPNKLLAASKKESEQPLLKARYVKGKTLLYVCENKACKKPVETVKEVLELVK
jgi:hypothetical protein